MHLFRDVDDKNEIYLLFAKLGTTEQRKAKVEMKHSFFFARILLFLPWLSFVLNLATVMIFRASMNKITCQSPLAFFYQEGTSRLFLFHQRQLSNPLAIDFPAKFFQYTLSFNPLLFVLPKDQ